MNEELTVESKFETGFDKSDHHNEMQEQKLLILVADGTG